VFKRASCGHDKQTTAAEGEETGFQFQQVSSQCYLDKLTNNCSSGEEIAFNVPRDSCWLDKPQQRKSLIVSKSNMIRKANQETKRTPAIGDKSVASGTSRTIS
jgi:hypothetical protein